ncbi:MAG: GNAT family protein [Chloroflexi bacterium]|nr:GNAT family protein [Chloroflexota bacterium]
MDIRPVTLVGRHVRLEPLDASYAEALFSEADEPEIWRYMPYGEVNSTDKLRAVIVDLLGRQARGTDLCFVTIDQASGRPIGMTRFMEINRNYRGLEIGGTWYGRAHRRTLANTEAKYMMLCHAFETWGCIRVQIRTDVRNERSQRSVERLGLVREGVLRKNMIMPDDYHRSSVFYSVIDDEWPAMKVRLEAWLV